MKVDWSLSYEQALHKSESLCQAFLEKANERWHRKSLHTLEKSKKMHKSELHRLLDSVQECNRLSELRERARLSIELLQYLQQNLDEVLGNVPGCPFFRVDDDGAILTMWKESSTLFYLWELQDTWREVQLFKRKDKAYFSLSGYGGICQAHILMLRTMIRHPTTGEVASFKDGNQENYSKDNLEWVPRSHMMKNVMLQRLKDDLLTLNEKQVNELISEYKRGVGVKSLAKKYGLRRRTVVTLVAKVKLERH